MEQSLSYALEFDDFLLHFCQFRGCALSGLFTGSLYIHAQSQQFGNLFEGETELLCPFYKANVLDRFF
jgi:hypothetical protein